MDEHHQRDRSDSADGVPPLFSVDHAVRDNDVQARSDVDPNVVVRDSHEVHDDGNRRQCAHSRKNGAPLY